MEISSIVLMILGVVFLIGEDSIIKQIRKAKKQNMIPTARLIILLFSVGSTLAGILSTLIQNHVNVYTFFPLYGILLVFFVKRSYREFRKLRAKIFKIGFIIQFTIGVYLLFAVGIYVFFMAPFASMM